MWKPYENMRVGCGHFVIRTRVRLSLKKSKEVGNNQSIGAEVLRTIRELNRGKEI